MRDIRITSDGEVHVLDQHVHTVHTDVLTDRVTVVLHNDVCITTSNGKVFTWDALPCGEVLYRDGRPYAVCVEPLHTEHSHDEGVHARVLEPHEPLFVDPGA